jgi:hypothetical protein
VHICNPSYSGGGGRKIMSLSLIREKLARPCLKNKIKPKGLRGVAQVVELLPSMCRVLGSIPSKRQGGVKLPSWTLNNYRDSTRATSMMTESNHASALPDACSSQSCLAIVLPVFF